jgi:bacteriorhodopsin
MGVALPFFYITGGIFAIASMVIAVYHVMQHLLNFKRPDYQTYICRILLMVPIYALTSWFSMIMP